MDTSLLQTYLAPAALLGFFAWRFFKFRAVKNQVPALLAAGAVVVDVRSRAEFLSGSREGSVNIPLGELERGAENIDREKPIILCCASGSRSAMGVSVLKRMGFKNVVNAGPWRNTVRG